VGIDEEEPLMRRLALACLLALGACASFSESECRSMDWRARGYEDGYFGNRPQDLRLAQVCGRYGVRVPEAEYFAGWRDGHDEWDRIIGSYGQD
jgi:Protein of unknown function (DUF2799)